MLSPHVTVVGAVGRRSTARLLGAIADATPGVEWPPTVVLLSPGDSLEPVGERRSWSEVLSTALPSATIIVPAGDARLQQVARLSGAKVVTFGFDAPADFRAERLDARSTGTAYVLDCDGARHDVRLALLGEHLAENSLAAIAAAVSAGIPVTDAIAAVESVGVVAAGVMQPLVGPAESLIIDDSRSLAPESVVAALKALAMFGTEGHRTVAVLGALDLPRDTGLAIGEAAERSRDAHDRIGRIVVRLNISKLIVVGQDARHIHNAAGLEGSWNGESVLVDTAGEAYDRVREDLGQGDAVLVKFRTAGDSTSLSALLTEEASSR